MGLGLLPGEKKEKKRKKKKTSPISRASLVKLNDGRLPEGCVCLCLCGGWGVGGGHNNGLGNPKGYINKATNIFSKGNQSREYHT